MGHWFGNRHVPDRWGRGLIAGHEFSDRFELYAEMYDLQDANRIDGEPKQRAFTFDIGGRQTLDRSGRLRLLFMGGRSLQAARATNSQPDWIAYLGVQVNFRDHGLKLLALQAPVHVALEVERGHVRIRRVGEPLAGSQLVRVSCGHGGPRCAGRGRLSFCTA